MQVASLAAQQLQFQLLKAADTEAVCIAAVAVQLLVTAIIT